MIQSIKPSDIIVLLRIIWWICYFTMSLTRKKEKASVIVNDNMGQAQKQFFNQVNGGERIFSIFINWNVYKNFFLRNSDFKYENWFFSSKLLQQTEMEIFVATDFSPFLWPECIFENTKYACAESHPYSRLFNRSTNFHDRFFSLITREINIWDTEIV